MIRRLAIVSIAAAMAVACSAEREAADAPEQTPIAEEDAKVTYVTTEDFEEKVLQSDIPVLVDFTAVWCVPCKIVDPIIMSLMPEMAGRARVFKLDIDESPEIYERLGVNGVPHILFFNKGVEQERIVSPQPREVYVAYLEALIEGRSTLEVSLTLIDDDSFRQHFIASRSIEDLEEAVAVSSDLLTKPFESGLTPLSMVLDQPGRGQNDKIAYILTQNPTISTWDLVGLGRCDEFRAALADDPQVVNIKNVVGVSAVNLALQRRRRLENGGCLRDLLDANPDLSEPPSVARPLGVTVLLTEDIALLTEFLDRGMSTATVDVGGSNALHQAVYYGYVDATKLLLERGADPGVETFQGKTALDIANEVRENRLSSVENRTRSENPGLYDALVERVEQSDAIIALLTADRE